MTSTSSPVAGLSTRPATVTHHYLPPHGTQYRYRGSRNGSWPGCHCEKCTLAHLRASKLRKLGHLRGTPPLVPAGPLLAHIGELNASGMANGLIARRAKVSHNTITCLVQGRTKSCRRAQAARILAVRPGDFDEVAEIPAAGTTRRIRALYAIGHGPKSIAATARLSQSSISHIANRIDRKVDASTAAAVSRAYGQLAGTAGTSDVARRRAVQMGWRDPVWWEDMGRIDDPAFDPATAERELNRDELGALRREEIEHLSSYGCDAETIAKRLHMHLGTVRAVLRELRAGERRDRKKTAA
ncbi:hypothetical protein [Streptomyces sp. NPDC096068]|uniref:hypothetical protein n=1 Tax=Streptomyces sp. NPDC096068 TaxID=3155424 RepID=UPI00331B7525